MLDMEEKRSEGRTQTHTHLGVSNNMKLSGFLKIGWFSHVCVQAHAMRRAVACRLQYRLKYWTLQRCFPDRLEVLTWQTQSYPQLNSCHNISSACTHECRKGHYASWRTELNSWLRFYTCHWAESAKCHLPQRGHVRWTRARTHTRTRTRTHTHTHTRPHTHTHTLVLRVCDIDNISIFLGIMMCIKWITWFFLCVFDLV